MKTILTVQCCSDQFKLEDGDRSGHNVRLKDGAKRLLSVPLNLVGEYGFDSYSKSHLSEVDSFVS